MQASEMVTDELLERGHAASIVAVWTLPDGASTQAITRAALEAVALDLYERGLRVAAEIARNACLVPPDGGSPTPEEQAVAQAAHDNILAALSAGEIAPPDKGEG